MSSVSSVEFCVGDEVGAENIMKTLEEQLG
jgi:hypothetical protein